MAWPKGKPRGKKAVEPTLERYESLDAGELVRQETTVVGEPVEVGEPQADETEIIEDPSLVSEEPEEIEEEEGGAVEIPSKPVPFRARTRKRFERDFVQGLERLTGMPYQACRMHWLRPELRAALDACWPNVPNSAFRDAVMGNLGEQLFLKVLPHMVGPVEHCLAVADGLEAIRLYVSQLRGLT